MANFTASEASTRIIRAPSSASATVGKLHSYFVAHEVTFVVFSNAFFGSLAAVKFDKPVTDFQFDVCDPSNLSKTTLEVLLARMVW
jgi:hypothetical protein